MTPENLIAPWILFEAGALSKTTEQTYVIPYLFQVEPSDIEEPLAQFQATTADKSDTKKLMHTLNQALKDSVFEEGALESAFLDETFEEQWPKLEQELKDILETQKEYDMPKIKSLISEPLIKVYGENYEAMKDL